MVLVLLATVSPALTIGPVKDPFRIMNKVTHSSLTISKMRVLFAQDLGCWSNGPSQFRGIGSFGNTCPEGLVRSGLLCYPPCNRHNFTGIGPICWGYGNETLNSYSRGVGKLMQCDPKTQDEIGEMCHPKCAHLFPEPDGLYCYAEKCPPKLTRCGSLCLKSTMSCASVELTLWSKMFKLVGGFGVSGQGLLGAAIANPSESQDAKVRDSSYAIKAGASGAIDGMDYAMYRASFPTCPSMSSANKTASH